MNDRQTEGEQRKTSGQLAWTVWCRFSVAFTSPKLYWPLALGLGLLVLNLLVHSDLTRGLERLQYATAENEFVVATLDGLQQQQNELKETEERIAKLQQQVQQVSRQFDTPELEEILQQAIAGLNLESVLVLDSQNSQFESKQLIRVPAANQMLVVEITRDEGPESWSRLQSTPSDPSGQKARRSKEQREKSRILGLQRLKYPLESSKAYRLAVLTRPLKSDYGAKKRSQLVVQVNDEILFEQEMLDHKLGVVSQVSAGADMALEPNVVMRPWMIQENRALIKQGYWCRLGSISLLFEPDTTGQPIAYRIRTYLASDAELYADIEGSPYEELSRAQLDRWRAAESPPTSDKPIDDPTLRRIEF